MDPDLVDDLRRDGFLFGVKLSLGRRTLGLTRSLELFQSLQAGQPMRPTGSEAAPGYAALGCLDHTGRWHKGAVFYRNTLTLGRLKFYLNHGLIPGQPLVGVPGDR